MIQNSKMHLFDGSSITKGKQILLSDFYEALIDWKIVLFVYSIPCQGIAGGVTACQWKKNWTQPKHIFKTWQFSMETDGIDLPCQETKIPWWWVWQGPKILVKFLNSAMFFLQHVFVAFVSGTFVHWLWGCMRRVCWASKCLPESQWKEKLHAH